MKRLFSYMRAYLKESILGPLFKLLEATLELIVPLIVALIIDRGIGNADIPYVIRMSLVLVLFGAVGLGFSVTAQYFAAKASVGTVTKLRHSLFKHIGTLSYTELDTLGTSTLITRMTSDANQIQQGLNLALRLLLRSPFVVFGAMVVAFTINAAAASTFAVAIPVLSVIVFGIMLISIPLYKRVQARLDGVVTSTRENLSGIRVIRAFCKEDDELRDFTNKNNALTQDQRFVGRIAALLNPLTYVIINFAVIILIHIGALKVDSGVLTQGEVVALYNLMGQILIELIKLANLIISITKAIASAHRIDSVFLVTSTDGARTGCCPEGEGDYAVEFRDVSLRYRGAGEKSLSNISFKIKHGETVGIIGGTGSGKTSLVNMIPRFYEASEGEVLIDGVNIKEYPTEPLRKKIGVVPQKALLFKGTVRQNLTWRKQDATNEEMLEALKIAQAKDFITEKGGLDFAIEQGGKNLSGGQRQRLSIARALVGSPNILILDDSASALDYATDASLRRAIREMDTGATVFIVSQRASAVMHADQILVLDDGECVGIGTHRALLEENEIYREIYYSQFEDGKEDA